MLSATHYAGMIARPWAYFELTMKNGSSWLNLVGRGDLSLENVSYCNANE